TVPNGEAIESLSLEQAIALVDEKAGRSDGSTTRGAVKTRTPRKAPMTEPASARTSRRARPGPRNGAASPGAKKTVASGPISAASARTAAVRKRATKAPSTKTATASAATKRRK